MSFDFHVVVRLGEKGRIFLGFAQCQLNARGQIILVSSRRWWTHRANARPSISPGMLMSVNSASTGSHSRMRTASAAWAASMTSNPAQRRLAAICEKLRIVSKKRLQYLRTHITVRIGSGRTTNASVPSTFQSIASRRPASRGRSALVLFLLRRQDDARTIRVTVRQLASGSHCGCAYGMSPDECRAIEPG
jgi:hypothetical protein